MWLRLLTPLAVAGLCLVVAPVGIFVGAVLLALQLAIIAIRICATIWIPRNQGTENVTIAPIFSVHVATHNEPPEMVIATLTALTQLDWPASDFEVIVMDNNTDDARLWCPVADWCATRNVHFIHRMGVQGAKAGALNIALQATRADATHIVTVDADYRVSTDFLKVADAVLRRTGADYVQFPQAYVHAAHTAAGIDAELEEYFRSTAQVADGAEAVLLTGTLCVISRAALVACGGWSMATTTEDAETGVALCSAGFTGRYIAQVVGRGYLPFSLRELEQQRHRWASGNLQTLTLHLSKIVGMQSRLGLRKRLAVLAQLTAWLNVSLLPALVLLLALVSQSRARTVVVIAAIAVILGIFDILWRIVHRGLREGHPFGTILRAFACRLALAPVSSQASFDTLVGHNLKFVVTAKRANSVRAVPLLPVKHVVLSAIAVAGLPAAAQYDPVVLLATMLLALLLPAALLTGGSLENYRTAVALANKGALT